MTTSPTQRSVVLYIILALTTLLVITAIIWFLSNPAYEPIALAIASLLVSDITALMRRHVGLAIAIFILGVMLFGTGIVIINTDLFRPTSPPAITISIRVSDNRAAPVPGARVLLFATGLPTSTNTDTDGIAVLTLQTSDTSGRLFVEKQGYSIYDQVIQLASDAAVDARLNTPEGENHNVIIRVIEGDSTPISAANVLLIAAEQSYPQVTDTNGIARFPLTFTSNTIDADISVSTPNYISKHLQATLNPEQVQYIQLNRETGDLTIGTPITQSPSQPRQPEQVVDTPQPTIPPLPLEQPVTVTISSPAQVGKHAFSGNAGDIFEIRVVPTSGILWPNIRLFKSGDAEPLTEAQMDGFTKTAKITQTLPESGDYTILVDSGGGTRTGTYDIYLQKLN